MVQLDALGDGIRVRIAPPGSAITVPPISALIVDETADGGAGRTSTATASAQTSLSNGNVYVTVDPSSGLVSAVRISDKTTLLQQETLQWGEAAPGSRNGSVSAYGEILNFCNGYRVRCSRFSPRCERCRLGASCNVHLNYVAPTSQTSILRRARPRGEGVWLGRASNRPCEPTAVLQAVSKLSMASGLYGSRRIHPFLHVCMTMHEQVLWVGCCTEGRLAEHFPLCSVCTTVS